MSTETKNGLDNIATALETEKKAVIKGLKDIKARVAAGISNIALLPTIHSDAIAKIQAFTPDNVHEEGHKADLAVYYEEFTALTDTLNVIKTKLANITEL